jgi:hypothetical protein
VSAQDRGDAGTLTMATTLNPDAQAADKLQWLMDRMEIQDLLNAYSRGIDHSDAEQMKQVYHPGAVDEHGIFSGDGDEFIHFTTEANRKRFQMMQHHHTTTSMDIREADAEVETYFLCVGKTHDGELHFSSGRSADRFEKREGRWGLVRRQVIMDWTMAMPEPVPGPNDSKFMPGTIEPDDYSRTMLPRLISGGFHPGRPPRPV